MIRGFSAICNVSEWMRYRRQLGCMWMSDANRLAREAIWKQNHRRTQRGRWLKTSY